MLEGTATQCVDPENRKVVFGDLECGGEFRVDGAGGKQPQFSQERAIMRDCGLGAALSK